MRNTIAALLLVSTAAPAVATHRGERGSRVGAARMLGAGPAELRERNGCQRVMIAGRNRADRASELVAAHHAAA
jgi:hypothetical protein